MAATDNLAERAASRVHARAAEAPVELLRSARAKAFRWALVRTGDADEAEDVAQEVALRVARRRPPDATEGSFRAWLYRVTVNVVIDLRRRKRRVRPADEEEIAALPSATRDALDAMVGAETRETLRRFMETLSVRQRELVQLVDVDGYSAVEAAELLGIDAATARVHLLRARRTLRSRLMEESIDEL